MAATPQAGGGLGAGVPALCLLAAVLTVAVYTELKENRIPNWLTLSGMAGGLLLGLLQGAAAFWASAGGLALGFGFLFLFYLFGGVGGGDVKLMGAAGALLGLGLLPTALVYTALLGALLGVVLVIWRRDFWARLAWGLRRLAFWRRGADEAPVPAEPLAIPYGVAIAAGCLLALFLHGMR